MKRILGLLSYLLIFPIIAFAAYVGWYGYVWGFNPFIAYELYIVCFAACCVLIVVGRLLRSKDAEF